MPTKKVGICKCCLSGSTAAGLVNELATDHQGLIDKGEKFVE